MNVPEPKGKQVIAFLGAILKSPDREEALTKACKLLRSSFSHYDWVGVYLLKGDKLHLGGWDGREPTEHTTISIDKGICGMAARENRTIILGDVGQNPNYLACFPYTRSEIVVPIRREGQVLGEIDIDGDRQNAYDDSDDKFLQQVADRIATIL